MSGIATAIIGTAVVGGIMSSNATKDAAETAAEAQTSSSDASIAESRYQFEQQQEQYNAAQAKVDELLSPYVTAGTSALSQQQALIGLNGYDAQDDAISALKNSSQYDQLISASEESILQNQAATGGVRGGDTQAALMQNSPNILNQLIESQYSKLGDLSNMGLSASNTVASSATGVASGISNAAQSTGSSISDALINSGNAEAQSALAQGQATSNMWGDISGAVGTYAGTL